MTENVQNVGNANVAFWIRARDAILAGSALKSRRIIRLSRSIKLYNTTDILADRFSEKCEIKKPALYDAKVFTFAIQERYKMNCIRLQQKRRAERKRRFFIQKFKNNAFVKSAKMQKVVTTSADFQSSAKL